MKNTILVFTMLGMLTAIGCAKDLNKQQPSTGQEFPVPPPPETYVIYRYFYGGFGLYVPPEQLQVGAELRSDGTLYAIYGDQHKVLKARVNVELVQGLLAKYSKVKNAGDFELKADGSLTLCDVYNAYEIFLNGAFLRVEEQANCGPHKVLQLKAGATGAVAPGDVSLPWLAYVMKDLGTGLNNAANLANEP